MSQLHFTDLHEYQKQTVNHIVRLPQSMLWLGLGLGKSICSLTAFDFLRQTGGARAMLVVAPLRVCELTWRQEAVKWSHTKHLTFSLMTGSAKKRQRALFRKADIYLVNYESLTWLATQLEHYFIDQNKPLPFDMIAFDEVSKVKRSMSKRFEAFAPIVKHIPRRVGLTASPCSNGMHDLWGQFFMIDEGQRLGANYSTFQSAFFYQKGKADYGKWEPYADTRDMIVNRIRDITVEMSAADHLDMPELSVIDVPVNLPPKKMAAYKDLETNFFIELDNGAEIEVFNAAALSNKLLQFCIAEGTEVLTNRGWIAIEAVVSSDLVWDGVEWASCDGSICNGYKVVVNCFGVDMTPDHEVLTTKGWYKAEDIINEQSSNRFKRQEFRLPEGYTTRRVVPDEAREERESDMAMSMCVRETGCATKPKSQIADKIYKVLRVPSRRGDTCGSQKERRSVTWYDGTKALGGMARNALSLQQPERQGLQKLRGTWNQLLSGMGDFREFLERHGERLSAPFNAGAYEQQRWLQQAELQMGYYPQTNEQQTKQRVYRNAARQNDGGTSGKKIQNKGGHTTPKSSRRMDDAAIVITTGSSSKASVYDILNSGKRNRYTVRSKDGSPVVVHNCNGIIYNYPDEQDPDYREIEFIHDEKYKALDDIITGSGDEPILLAYQFTSERDEIMKRYPHAECLTGVKEHEAIDIMTRFNAGKIKLLIAHPLSAGHGLNLQEACHIVVWFGLGYNLELYEQFIGRIDRQGQKNPVQCFRIVCVDTMDYAVMDALEHKDETQTAMRDAIGRYRNG